MGSPCGERRADRLRSLRENEPTPPRFRWDRSAAIGPRFPRTTGRAWPARTMTYRHDEMQLFFRGVRGRMPITPIKSTQVPAWLGMPHIDPIVRTYCATSDTSSRRDLEMRISGVQPQLPSDSVPGGVAFRPIAPETVTPYRCGVMYMLHDSVRVSLTNDQDRISLNFCGF
jgi:hypothetical protein